MNEFYGQQLMPQQYGDLAPQGFFGGLLGAPLGGLIGRGIGGLFGNANLGRQIGSAAGGIGGNSNYNSYNSNYNSSYNNSNSCSRRKWRSSHRRAGLATSSKAWAGRWAA
jgi:uncharacterized protein YcfJ